MSISIGGFNFNRLTAQPFGYDETETSRGFTAKKWSISGLVTPAEWITLLGVYDNWRDTRITDPDPVVSNSTGTTVNFSGKGAGGVTWNTDCWFSTTPQGVQDGIYISISVELVDAAEALAVLKASATSGSGGSTTLAGTVSIGGVTFSRLTAQTSGYEETDTRRGRTAKRWSVTGLLDSSEWGSLLSIYDAWRDAKIAEDDPLVTQVVGATVGITGTGVNGTNWSATCWFSGAPQGDPDQSGSYISASVELVDAAQALAVLIASSEEDGGGGDVPPDLGTVTVGTAVLTLRKPHETFQSVPTLELTAAGTSYITGPRNAVEVEDIEGETDEAGWNAVRTWFKTTMESTPNPGDWYPISVPTASAERRIVSGSPQNIYTVSLQRAKAR